MDGTVDNAMSDIPQSLRYASLSSGLDIKKTLGGQQIAVAETTDIDQVNGTVNLVRLHLRGVDLITAGLPDIRDLRAPPDGSSATYARRYALFTMVGIAGEDDLDAPDVTNDRAEGRKAIATGVDPSAAPASVRPGQFRTRNPTTPPVREKLGVEESAAIRGQLILEIETLPGDDLQPRAIAILKAKNRLSADDAKRVEDAFATRMALQAALPEDIATDGPRPALTDPAPPQPTAASKGAAKPPRPRGPPRKVKAATQQSGAPPVISKPIDANFVPASTHVQNGAAPAKIDKSVLTISEVRRLRDKTHLKFVASQPCLVCGRSPADAHHLRFAQPRAMGRKVSDEFTVPLCRTHHRDNHRG